MAYSATSASDPLDLREVGGNAEASEVHGYVGRSVPLISQ